MVTCRAHECSTRQKVTNCKLAQLEKRKHGTYKSWLLNVKLLDGSLTAFLETIFAMFLVVIQDLRSVSPPLLDI